MEIAKLANSTELTKAQISANTQLQTAQDLASDNAVNNNAPL